MLSTKDIRKYRKLAKKIGIWDKDYSSIKQDMMGEIADIRNRDYAFDILGGCVHQVVLMIRLIVYGESEVPLSEDDMKALFAPLEQLESLKYTPYLATQGVETFVDNVLPIVFKVAETYPSYDEFEHALRVTMAGPSGVTRMSLSYGLAIGMCMRLYDNMQEHLQTLVSYLTNMLSSSKRATEVLRAIDERYHSTFAAKQSFRFAALFATASTECNIGDGISYDEMYDVIDKINELSKNNKDMYDFINDETKFKLFMYGIEKYHED